MKPKKGARPRSGTVVTKARLVAHEVLVRVASEGAFADRALDALITRADLDDRDVRLATELVYGTLRHRRRLDFLLASLAESPLAKVPPATLAALRLGAYQLLELRVADHSAVNESVALVRHHHAYQAGFANAVLRSLARQRDAGTLADPRVGIAEPLEALAVATSQPTWVLARVAEEFGIEEATAFATANNELPPLGLRVNLLRTTPDVIVNGLSEIGAQVEQVPGLPATLLVRNVGSPARLSQFVAGEVTVQDPAAQLVGYLAAPTPGTVVIDACAAPGGKATHLAELMDDRGLVLAADIHAGKLRLVRDAAARLGTSAVVTTTADAGDPDALRRALAAALIATGVRESNSAPALVLVDAPCSGSGTLRRNPEVRDRPEASLHELTLLQDRLLDSTASLLLPGGILVYAVCSVTPEEGPERMRSFLGRHPEFVLTPSIDTRLAPYLSALGDGQVLRTWPHRHGMDGFFAARLCRR